MSVMGGLVRCRSRPQVLSKALPQGGAMNVMSSSPEATETPVSPERQSRFRMSMGNPELRYFAD